MFTFPFPPFFDMPGRAVLREAGVSGQIHGEMAGRGARVKACAHAAAKGVGCVWLVESFFPSSCSTLLLRSDSLTSHASPHSAAMASTANVAPKDSTHAEIDAALERLQRVRELFFG